MINTSGYLADKYSFKNVIVIFSSMGGLFLLSFAAQSLHLFTSNSRASFLDEHRDQSHHCRLWKSLIPNLQG